MAPAASAASRADRSAAAVRKTTGIGAVIGSDLSARQVAYPSGAGIIASLNDRQLNDKPINSELAYQIYLRMFMGPNVPEELRNRLLGLGNG